MLSLEQGTYNLTVERQGNNVTILIIINMESIKNITTTLTQYNINIKK